MIASWSRLAFASHSSDSMYPKHANFMVCPLFLGAGFERRHLANLANFALAIAGKREKSLSPLDRLLLGFHLKQREAADHFFRLREGPVVDRELPSRNPHSRAFGARKAPL